MKQSNKYEMYFITVYPTNRKVNYDYLLYIFRIITSLLNNIIVYAYCGLSLQDNNDKLRHPHLHALIYSKKSVSYRIITNALVKKLNRSISIKIYKIDDDIPIKRYILKHDVKYIYTEKQIIKYGRENEEKVDLSVRRNMGRTRKSIIEKTKAEEQNNSRIHHKRTTKRRNRNMNNEQNKNEIENILEQAVDEVIEVDENDNIYELYFIKDVIQTKYGDTDYSNYGIRVHIPPLLYKQFQMIADYIDVSMTDLLRYIIYTIVKTAENKNLFPEIHDELHLRNVFLKRKTGKGRIIRIVNIPVDEIESSIVKTASKILSSKYRYRIIDDDGKISKPNLF